MLATAFNYNLKLLVSEDIVGWDCKQEESYVTLLLLLIAKIFPHRLSTQKRGLKQWIHLATLILLLRILPVPPLLALILTTKCDIFLISILTLCQTSHRRPLLID